MGLYHSTDTDGISRVNPTRREMLALLASLDDPEVADSDHPDVSLTNDDLGYTVSVYPGGLVALDNLNAPDTPPATILGFKKEGCLKLWTLLAEGDLDALLRLPWIRIPEP